MVLFSFSIPEHIPMIKNGSKHQTTRRPRKTRSNGQPAYSVFDKVQLYYRSRMKESCENCISKCSYERGGVLGLVFPCRFWSNFFGESGIIDIIHYHRGAYKERFHEVWTGYTLAHVDDEDRERWSKADGFGSWDEAGDWFMKKTGDPNWADQNLDVIIWDAEPIIKRWRQK